MSNEPLILAARRRARMLSRQSGNSYQSHLEEIARQAGRANWLEFLSSPAAMPDPDPDHAKDEPDQEDGPGDAVPIEAEDPVPIEAVEPTQTRPSRAARVRRWSKGIVAVMMVAGLIALAAFQQNALRDVAYQVTMDRANHASADWFQRNIPLAHNVVIGDMHMVDLVMVDDRAQFATWTYSVPTSLGFKGRPVFGGDTVEMREAMKRSPILMIRMHANCRTGKWRLAGIAAADSYDLPVVRAEYARRRQGSWTSMSERNRHAVCDAPEDPRPEYAPKPTPRQEAMQSLPARDPSLRHRAHDAEWYGIDVLHPKYVDAVRPSAPARVVAWMKSLIWPTYDLGFKDVRTPTGWSNADQWNGLEGQVDSGPEVRLYIDTHSQAAAAAETRRIAADLAKRFELGGHASPLVNGSGRLVMTIAFSAIPRSDRPTSDVVRRVELEEWDRKVVLRVKLRTRYWQAIDEWRNKHDAES